MITKKYDLAVPVSTYKTRDGQEKSKWENIGAVMQGDKSAYIQLKASFNPAAIKRKDGSEYIIVCLFPPKEQKNSYNSQPAQSNEPKQDFDFDVVSGNIEDFPF